MATTRGRARPPARGKASSSGSSRRTELLAVAAEVFAELGYSRTTVRDIGERAGILNGSLYYHFDSKEAMVDELLRPYFDDLAARYAALGIETSPIDETLVGLIRETLVLAFERIHVVQLVQRDWQFLADTFPYVRKGLAGAEATWVSVIERGIAQGVFRAGQDPKVVYRSIRSAIFDVTYWDARTGGIAVDQLVEMLVTLFLSGLRAD